MATPGVTAPGQDEQSVEQKDLRFSVASKLWRELGERLVGRKAIALAELIKNSYDADAKEVTVTVDLSSDVITVEDDGHGMTWEEFATHWATLGDTHKERQEKSPECGRPLTGSKGVGRISTRVLGNVVEVHTVSKKHPNIEVHATVDWQDALQLDFLTETPIDCQRITHTVPQKPGTRIKLRSLRGEWDAGEIRDMASEVWKLQPPFPNLKPRTSKCPFEVSFQSPEGELTRAFKEEVKKVLEAHEARIQGTIRKGVLEATLEFGREAPLKLEHRIGEGKLNHARFEIRVYKLKGRQRGGVRLKDIGDYLREFRGVHIYDSGFRLPYYGYAEADWLGLTMDQTRRLSMSRLLPEGLRVPEGLHHLPHVDHLLGAVAVDTSTEGHLSINIGRDRLNEEQAGFRELRGGIRTALDWYANEKARRRYRETERTVSSEPPARSLNAILEVVQEHRAAIPESTAKQIEKGLKKVVRDVRQSEEVATKRVALMASLATAGVAAVAYQHEMAKQILAAETLINRIETTVGGGRAKPSDELGHLVEDMRSWVERTRAIGGLFSHFTEMENIQETKRYNVRRTVGHVLRELQPLIPDVTYSHDLDEDLDFPPAALADWVAILQNVIFNAANAMQESPKKRLRFVGRRKKRISHLIVQDTGHGVELGEADELFEPFKRRGDLAPERRAAGFGGMGLGLTIVKMIAEQRDCSITFVEPETGFSTAFKIEWRNSS